MTERERVITKLTTFIKTIKQNEIALQKSLHVLVVWSTKSLNVRQKNRVGVINQKKP